MIVRTASKVRAYLDDFSEKLSSGLSKPARRFVSEALYGIAARGGVRLSEIGRAAPTGKAPPYHGAHPLQTIQCESGRCQPGLTVGIIRGLQR